MLDKLKCVPEWEAMSMKRHPTVWRMMLITIAALAMIGASVAPAAADTPTGSRDFAPVGRLIPFTPAEQAMIAQKHAVTAVLMANLDAASVTPQGPDPCLPDERGNQHCAPYYGTLATNYRHQQNSYFCGPAAVQVVSNYTWGTGLTNKYSQSSISTTWTHTTSSAGTSVSRERIGLNGASVLPGGFIYEEFLMSGAQVAAGDDWHDKLRVDIDGWEMPQVENVAPHNPGWTYFLASWPNAVTAGHYIVADGWDTIWNGQYGSAGAEVSYDDGSAGYSGKDGHFWDPARTVFYTIWKHHKYIIW